MLNVMIKAGGFVLIVLLGYLFKKRGLISLAEGKTLSKIVMNITLPCALLLSAKGLSISFFLLLPMFLGILGNLVMLLLGYLRGRHKTGSAKTQDIYQLSGFNIGNFAFPFVQSFFPTSYLMYIVLFDTGNAIMLFGGNTSLTSIISHQEENFSVQQLVKKLFSSVPFCTYLLCFILSLCHLTVPQSILTIAKIGADANPFLAMFVLGVMVELHSNRAAIKELVELLNLRLFGSALMIALVLLLPLNPVVKSMLAICLLSPIAVVTPLYAQELGVESSVPATINSVTIISSIILTTSYLLLTA